VRKLSFVLLLAVLLIGCPRRPKPPEPQPQPPVTETMATQPPVTETTVTTETPFQQSEEPKVVDEDIETLNERLRREGLIRDAFFGFDEATLDAEAQANLQQSATWLRANSQYSLLVQGHCDDRGTEQYNLALGDRRASTAAQFLETLGVDRDRIRTVSYGEERPFQEGSSEEAWKENRRAHLVLVKR